MTPSEQSLALVVTTIAQPTHQMLAHSVIAQRQGSSIVVAGDEKGPNTFEMPNTTFLSLEDQREFSALGRTLDTGTYARKNIAYLRAIADGADLIVETDDDNAPMDGFERKRSRRFTARTVDRPGWFNVYSVFSDSGVWPRGLPLECVQEAAGVSYDELPERSIEAPIQQGLADGDPDVDAVYRLTRPLPITFEPSRVVALAPGTWSPFNSQNTTWFPEAFPLLYLPSHCSFRVTDIWRSFVAQRVAWANGWSIAFTSPDVFQDRNAHDLLADFRDEVPGYLDNSRIAAALEALDLAPGNLEGSLVRCYETLVDLGSVGSEELNLLQLWLEEVGTHMRAQMASR
jgi:hypothetical protein